MSHLALSGPLAAYVAAWLAACVLALVLLVRGRREFVVCRRAYWRFIAQPWKLATFAIAWGGLTVIAPYTGDPTWDRTGDRKSDTATTPMVALIYTPTPPLPLDARGREP